MDLFVFAEDFRRADEVPERAGLFDLTQNLRIAGFHSDIDGDASGRGHGGDQFFGAGGRNQSIGGVPGYLDIAADDLVEHRQSALLVLEQIVVEPHDMANAILLDEQLNLVDNIHIAALANAFAVEIPHRAERALRSAASVR